MMRSSLPNYSATFAEHSHNGLVLNGRPFAPKSAAFSRLCDVGEGETRDNIRNVFIAVCEAFIAEIDAQKLACPVAASEQGYLKGWEAALGTVYDLAIQCLGSHPYNPFPGHESSVEFGNDAKPSGQEVFDDSESNEQGPRLHPLDHSLPSPELPAGLTLRTRPHQRTTVTFADDNYCGYVNRGLRQRWLGKIFPRSKSPTKFRGKTTKDDSKSVDKADILELAIRDLRHRSLDRRLGEPRSSIESNSNATRPGPMAFDESGSGRLTKVGKESMNKFGSDISSQSKAKNDGDYASEASQASSSPMNTPSTVSINDSVLQALSTPSHSKPNRRHRNLNRSEIIRDLDTAQLLTHFERRSRLSERRIAAELAWTSILRQAIFQDRFLGRVPLFAGTPDDYDGDSDTDAADVASGINNPFLGEAQQDRAVKQVKTLFRQWRNAAAEAGIEAEEDECDGPSGGWVIPRGDPESWFARNGEGAPAPDPRSRSI